MVALPLNHWIPLIRGSQYVVCELPMCLVRLGYSTPWLCSAAGTHHLIFSCRWSVSCIPQLSSEICCSYFRPRYVVNDFVRPWIWPALPQFTKHGSGATGLSATIWSQLIWPYLSMTNCQSYGLERAGLKMSSATKHHFESVWACPSDCRFLSGIFVQSILEWTTQQNT